MATKRISATEAARNFSNVINQIRYQLVEFDVTRGKEVVARIVPPSKGPSGIPIRELNAFFRSLPPLEENDVDVFLDDIASGLSLVVDTPPKWD